MTREQLNACCGSERWTAEMFGRQPFGDGNAMHEAADEVWWGLQPEDWLEAFSKHPKIGQKTGTQWSMQEQSGMAQAADQVAEEMRRLNLEYATKFGFIFIVCASGKSADEMLKLLRTRMNNRRDVEINNAAGEQAKITHLRLDKL